MSALTRNEKLKIIRDLCEKHKITAYAIGEGTNMDPSGIQRILNGETKKPREKTLDSILNYLDDILVGSDIPNSFISSISEPTTPYSIKSEEILKAIEELEQIIEQKHNIFSQALELSLLDTSEIKNNTSIILKNTNNLPESFSRLTTLIKKRLGS